MLNMLARNWWLVEIRGAAAIAFGLLAIFWPGLTLILLVNLLGAYFFVDGFVLLLSVLRGEPGTRGHGLVIGLMGLLGIAVGIATFFRPELTAVALVYLVAFWAVALGGIQVIAAFRLRRDVAGELWLVIGGLVTIAFGLFIAAFPGDGLISLVQILGIWAIFFGITSLILASRLRGLHHAILRSRVVKTAR